MVPQLVVILYILKLGQEIQFFNGQHHLCALVNEQGSHCFLPVLETIDLILILAELKNQFIQADFPA